MNFESFLAAQAPQVPQASAAAVLALAADGATVPFIARYRKERTGNLDEVAIRAVLEAREEWDGILARQAFIVEEIERQKKLTPELRERILATFDRDALEDLYLPYKRKRQSRAAAARDADLEPLADWIWGCGHGTETPQPGQTLELWAFTFRNEEKGFADADSAIRGAADILIERLSESLELRERVRRELREKGQVVSRRGKKPKPASRFEKYFEHRESVASLAKPENSHRYLAIRRGVAEEELAVAIEASPDDQELDERLQRAFDWAACTVPESPGAEVLRQVARTALGEHVRPSIEGEIHKALRQVADDVAIEVFAANVQKVLLSPPFGARAVLGVDPGIRTGCKVAVVEAAGGYVKSTVFKLKSEEARAAAKKELVALVREHAVQAVAVGNGTGSREAETFVRASLGESDCRDVPVALVSEAGASVYSASDLARAEFPELDLTVRGAISIARRLQDPLAELVKIDPKSIGVGQYQHDIPPHRLKRRLDQVVESCVNQVGIDLNTASPPLLTHVSGIGEALAAAIVEQREKAGLFRSRRQLLDVPRFGAKAFEQAAGFLRIRDGDHPLDATGVHPERYEVLERFAASVGKEVGELVGAGVAIVKQAEALRRDVGPFTFDDIVAELANRGRDPREEFVPFRFREDVHAIADLKPGMTCPGIVTNVTSFGAFVDIGVHQDGLVHVSQLADRFVRDPRDVVSPGDRVDVRVLEANVEKGQISLSMKRAERTERGERHGAASHGGASGRGRREGTAAHEAREGARSRPWEKRDRDRGPGADGGERSRADARGRDGDRGHAGGPAAGRGAEARRFAERDRRPDRQGESRDRARPDLAAKGGGSKPRKPAEPFNNPFTALLAIRDTFKPKP